MNNRFTERAEAALNRSVNIAEELGHTYIGTEHVMLALFDDDSASSAHILKKSKISYESYRKAVADYSGIGMKSSLSSQDITPRCRKILENAYSTAGKHQCGVVGTEHILYALLDERDCIATKLLKGLGGDIASLKDDALSMLRARGCECRDAVSIQAPILNQYGKNFIELAKRDKFDPVIGRESETDRIIRVLCRKNKNNPCLIGEAGVGKSAIIEGLSLRIARGEVPSYLRGKVIISVDLTSMVAGAKYRGDFEERIKGIINEATRNKSIILFIDEIHTIVGAGAAEGAIDASNILKPQLSRGELQIIGATTFAEYRKHIQRDPALERRFQPITVEEPDIAQTVQMLSGVKSRYEAHHGVRISNEVIEACVTLSSKYITDRFLPDKAIDLLDEACAYVAFKADGTTRKNLFSDEITRQIENARSDKDASIVSDGSAAVRGLLLSDMQRQGVFGVGMGLHINDVSTEDVKYIVSEMTGIDLTSVKSNIDYQDLEERLKSRVIGQNEAVEKLLIAIKRSEVGLGESSAPRATFLFAGGSGVGKTALAAALAEELFGSNSALLRLDMSEYSEKYAVSKLIGSPPGYTGHDEGGILTEAVRKRPYCVVLFDEIEKADREVQNLFLQIADSGYLTDSSGKRVSFRNAYVIMTSNAVTANSVEIRQMGFIEHGMRRDTKVISALRQRFSDEFINRFDEIILFNDLDDYAKEKIVILTLDKLSEKLRMRGVKLEFSQNLITHILSSVDTDRFGARPILHFIATNIENSLSDFLVLHPALKNASITIDIEDGKVRVSEAECETL